MANEKYKDMREMSITSLDFWEAFKNNYKAFCEFQNSFYGYGFCAFIHELVYSRAIVVDGENYIKDKLKRNLSASELLDYESRKKYKRYWFDPDNVEKRIKLIDRVIEGLKKI